MRPCGGTIPFVAENWFASTGNLTAAANYHNRAEPLDGSPYDILSVFEVGGLATRGMAAPR